MKIRLLPTLCLLGAVSTVPMFAQAAPEKAPAPATEKMTRKGKKAATDSADAATDTAKTAAKTTTKKMSKGGPTVNASAADIAAAKAKGLVWVNTGTGVYHKDGEFFGATKQGKFMTEAEAQAAKYRAAKDGGHSAKPATK